MKRTIGVLVLLCLALLMGAGNAEAADLSMMYSRNLRYMLNGQRLSNGQIVPVTRGQPVEIDVYGTGYLPARNGAEVRPGFYDMLPPDTEDETEWDGPSVEIVPDNSGFTTYFDINPDRVLESDLIGTIRLITPDLPSLIPVSIRYIVRWAVLDNFHQPIPSYAYTNEPFRLWFAPQSGLGIGPDPDPNNPDPNDGWQILQPQKISLRDANGQFVNAIHMKAGTSREFYVEVDDKNFYVVKPETMDYVLTATDSVVDVESSVPHVLVHRTGDPLPGRLATVRVSAINQGGNQNSTFNPAYGSLKWGVTYTYGSGASQTISTQTIAVRVDPRDDAGGGDDSGGTCNAVALGSLALLLPAAFLFIRKRR